MPAEIKIGPRTPRGPILEALCATLDLCSRDNRLAEPIRQYMSGRLSKDPLLDAIVEHAQNGCKQAAVVGLALAGIEIPKEIAHKINAAVACAFADSAFILSALAAMRRDDDRFPAIAEAAIKPAQAVTAQLGGPVAAIDLMFQRAAAEAPLAPAGGRNQPCPCGSGKKKKLCCVKEAPR